MYQGINHGDVGLGRGGPVSKDLVLDAQRGDRAAFEEIVQNYEMVVMRVALNLTGSQDSAQQIYFRVFKDAFCCINQLNPRSSVFIWLYRILVRHCLEHCRRCPRAIETDLSGKDFEHRLRRAIRSLTPTERVVLQLKQYQGLKIRTLAEIFDATPEFVVKSLQNANSHLQRQLKADVPDPLCREGCCHENLGLLLPPAPECLVQRHVVCQLGVPRLRQGQL